MEKERHECPSRLLFAELVGQIGKRLSYPKVEIERK